MADTTISLSVEDVREAVKEWVAARRLALDGATVTVSVLTHPVSRGYGVSQHTVHEVGIKVHVK